MDLVGKNILVIGNARSGIGAAKLAKLDGANSTIYDEKAYEKWDVKSQAQIDDLKKKGINYILGQDPDVNSYDLAILSPGVPQDIPLVDALKKAGVKITGELEFASWHVNAPIIAITGTNGKTTTTTLVGEIMKSYNPKTFVVGNIGNTFSEEVPNITDDSIIVAEVSSFQLETADTFHPKVSALLNITPDHLNRHKTMENYCRCKYQVFVNQTAEDFALLNVRDEYYEDAKKYIKCNQIDFSSSHEVARGAYLKGNVLCENINGTEHEVCTTDELIIKGTHNVENALSAIAIATAFGVSTELIRNVLINFKGVEHRTEFVVTKNGVDYFNDSKATNTDAAIAGLVGLSSLKKPIRLIAGGMDKKISFEDWVKLFNGIVEKVYIIGETKQLIVDECKKQGFNNYETYNTLEEATMAAAKEAKSGEVVLLSPACASWDMFESYEVRGRLFKDLVRSL